MASFKVVLCLTFLAVAMAQTLNDAKLNKLCGNDQACRTAAERCATQLKKGDLDPEKYDTYKTTFQSCTEKAKLSTQYSAYRNENPPPTNEDIELGKKYLLTFVKGLGVSNEATSLKCCLAQSTGMYQDNTLDRSAIKAKLTKLITTDATVLQAFLTAVDACPEPANCNVHEFKNCTLKKCIDATKA